LFGQFNETIGAGATLKVEEQAAVLLQSSVAVKLTVVLPPQMLGGIAPASPVVAGGPQLSIAEKPAIQVLKLAVKLGGQDGKLTDAGHVTVGGVGSVTVTSNIH